MTQLNGVYPAIVINNVDPDELGRIQVRIPNVSASGKPEYTAWARLATLMAGNNRGTWFIPDIDDEVLVAFEAGDLRKPYVIGSMWNTTSLPPEIIDTDNNKKLLRSRNGVVITLDDQNGHESFIVETPGGQKITLKDNPDSIEITDGASSSVTLEVAGITVHTNLNVIVNATLVEINSAAVTVNSAMSRFSGVVQCDTLISNRVISASYTPGAGNIW